MTAFRDQLSQFSAKIEARTQAVFVNTVSAAKHSITDGSPITGAPGSPVDTGDLKTSWQIFNIGPTTAEISTSLPYAPANEYGINNGKPYTQKSPVGGRHSVALTAAGIQRLVDDVAKRLGS